MNSPSTTVQKIIAIFIAVITWFALIVQFVLILDPAITTGFSSFKSAVNFFSYFTIQSNLLVAISLTCSTLMPDASAGRFFSSMNVRSAIAVYIFIVGLVYNLILRSIWDPQGWQLLVDNLLHTAIPLLYMVYWFLYIPARQLQWRQLPAWLIFPAVYLMYTLIRGAYVNWYPYPFVHAGELGYGKVAVNSLAMLVAFLFTGAGIIVINRAKGKNVKK